MTTPADKLPVSLVTGFLGSGKTTLLRHLLSRPDMGDTAVIVNELGEIGLDHQLLEMSEDDVVVLNSGCLCCTVRSDLGRTLSELSERRERGSVTAYRRVLVETTGLADPAPILHTLMQDPLVTHRHALDLVVTTVDGLFGRGQLDGHRESRKQAAVADRLLITKTDVAGRGEIAELRRRLGALNPSAAISEIEHGGIDPAVLFAGGLFELAARAEAVRQWIHADGHDEHPSVDDGHAHRHDHDIRAYCFVYENPIDWRYFSPNLAALVSRHADRLLRVKGILNVAGEDAPVVVHGVQHQFQRLRLGAWPDGDRRSKLVLITRGLDRGFLSDCLQDRRLS